MNDSYSDNPIFGQPNNIEMYTLNLYNFINQCNPNTFNKNRMMVPIP